MLENIIAKMLDEANVEKGKMFGWDCLKVGGNVYLAWKNADVVAFKIAESEMEAAMNTPGVMEHDPGNRGMPMKQWIFSTDPKFWPRFSDLALDYCRTLPPKKGK